MAIRDKLRKTFSSRSKGTSSGDSTPSQSSNPNHYTGRTDIEYYKPNEIPKSKYRGRVDKAHQDSLESYSFADAFTTLRRKSSQALSGFMSPGGTNAQSRRTSWVSRHTRGSVSSTNSKSIASEREGRSLGGRKSVVTGIPSSRGVSRVRENSDDDTDVANTGLSRQETAIDQRLPMPTFRLDRTATVTDPNRRDINGIASTPLHDQPFTADELEKAMTRVTMHANDPSTLRDSAVAVN